MAFDANRDIKIEASQGADGLFTLRTKGLAERRRPELEIASLPEAALRAAAGVMNQVAGYTVNTAEVLAEQTVGFVLGDEDDDDARPLMLALRAIVAEPPKTGLFARLGGGGKGVLRLVDVTDAHAHERAPLTAVSTMLVHRARVRRGDGDEDGAREELEAAIAIFEGEEGTGSGPTVGDGSAPLNWQNHLAHLALAELEGDAGDEDRAAAHFRRALARSDALARAELGASLGELAKVSGDDLERIAAAIVAHNLGGDARYPGVVPSPAHALFVSPLWQPIGDGKVGRHASLVPAGFGELYYEGAAAEGLRRAGAHMAASVVKDALDDPAPLAWSIRDVRGLWKDDHAPVAQAVGDLHPAHGLLSSVLVFAGRAFRAGATETQIAAALRGEDDGDALAALLIAQGEWEREQFRAALSLGES